MFDTATPTTVFGLLVGGAMLLLYGVRLVTDAMQRATGVRLRSATMQLARQPLAAFGIGVLATVLTQSSGASSALLVGLVNAQLVELPPAVVILLGANVGSTLVVQLLALHITNYAVVLAGLGAAAAMAARRTALLEEIGDIIDKQIMRLARRKRRSQLAFSDEGWNDLLSYHSEVTAALQQALAAQDSTIAAEFLARKTRLTQMKRQFHLRHLHRLRSGLPPSVASSAIHLDLLDAMSRVLSHASNIAHAVHGDL
jgi:Na+/phosphate symporter